MVPLLVAADFSHVAKPFKNSRFKSSGKRLRNLKAALIEEQKRLAQLDPQQASSDEKATYFSLEAPPSIIPRKHWCDITGLPGTYKIPATGLRYYNKEVYGIIQEGGPGLDQQYLSLRSANVVLR